MNQHKAISAERPATVGDRWLELVQEQVNTLRFGVVQIVVHNSRITQIDRTERLRLDPPPVLSFSNPSSNQPDHWRQTQP
jgi:hypothetical protein